MCEGLFLILPTTFILKRAGVILRGVLLLILVLLTSVYITIQLPVVQQALTSRIAIYLSQELKTEVTTLKTELSEVKATLDSVSNDTGISFKLLAIPDNKKN